MRSTHLVRLALLSLVGAATGSAEAQPAPLVTEVAQLTSTVPTPFGERLGASVAVLDGPPEDVLGGARIYAAATQHSGEYQYQGGLYAFWPDKWAGWFVADTLVAPADRNRLQDWVGLRATAALRLEDGTDLVVASSHLLDDPNDWRRIAGGAEVFRLWPPGHPDGEPDRVKWTYEGSLVYPEDVSTGRQPLRNGEDLALIYDPEMPGAVLLFTGATADTDLSVQTGQICTFRRSPDGQWSAIQTFTFQSPLATTGFIGNTVSASASTAISGGQVALAGARNANLGNGNEGTAYLLERQADGSWREAVRFQADDLSTSEAFGWDVELVDAPEGLFAFVGHAYEPVAGPGEPHGALYVYRRSGESVEGLGVWEREATLRASGPTGRFGWNLSAAARSGGGIVLGVTAQSASTPEQPSGLSGAAYVYHRDPTTAAWKAVARLGPSNPGTSGYYGDDISVTPGGLATVGRSWRLPDDWNGSAYLYDLRPLLPVATASAPTAQEAISIQQVWPQPATTAASVAVRVAYPGAIRVRLIDMLGRVVQDIRDVERPPGTHEVPVDLSGLAPGIYAIRAEVGDATAAARLVVAR